MIQTKSSKVLPKALKKIVIILLIMAFSIGIIACSGDAITGSGGRGYTSVTDGGGLPENPDSPDTPDVPGDTNSGGNTGGDTNTTGGNTGGNTNTTGGNTGGDTPPSLPGDNPGDYYDLRVPFVVKTGFTNVSYKDTNKLKQLWFDQINRKGMNDGKVFAIKNKDNNRGINNFQQKHTWGKYSARDYFYFKDNGDIVYKEEPDTVIKKFLGAVIISYRDVSIDRGHIQSVYRGQDNRKAIVKIKWSERKQNGKPLYTVGGLYANTMTTEGARNKYYGDDHFKYGIFDFIAFRHDVEDFHNGYSYKNHQFERQYITPGFLEVFVMADYFYDLPAGGCAALHSYHPYYGSGNTTNGFTPKTMNYMTNYNLYLAQRPEYILNLLNCTIEFTDAYYTRKWHYMFMPGTPDSAVRSVSINPIPTW